MSYAFTPITFVFQPGGVQRWLHALHGGGGCQLVGHELDERGECARSHRGDDRTDPMRTVNPFTAQTGK